MKKTKYKITVCGTLNYYADTLEEAKELANEFKLEGFPVVVTDFEVVEDDTK